MKLIYLQSHFSTLRPSTFGYSGWGSWMIRLGLVFILVNSLVFYLFIKYLLIPYLANGGSLQNFEHFIYTQRTSSLVNSPQHILAVTSQPNAAFTVYTPTATLDITTRPITESYTTMPTPDVTTQPIAKSVVYL